jgi:hypothetical protein
MDIGDEYPAIKVGEVHMIGAEVRRHTGLLELDVLRVYPGLHHSSVLPAMMAALIASLTKLGTYYILSQNIVTK